MLHASARAQRESAILRAEGEAQAAALNGEAQARVIQQVGVAVAANPTVIPYEAAHRWNGQLPGTMLGGTTPPLTMFNLQPGQRPGTATPTVASVDPSHVAVP
jgi:regulator of protease activity HflC (stomatin/prohibitin superfamily)